MSKKSLPKKSSETKQPRLYHDWKGRILRNLQLANADSMFSIMKNYSHKKSKLKRQNLQIKFNLASLCKYKQKDSDYKQWWYNSVTIIKQN